MDIVFALLGGLGLFLYGMDAMSKGIQLISGNKLKGLLRTLTKNRFIGVLSGTLTTVVIQSSSVTTVMVVGFVNAGLMALPQAISIILGAHIGTTITAQIIAFKLQNFALPIIAVGAILHLFPKSDRIKNIGNAVFGFGVLFFGLNLMGIAFNPLKENGLFQMLLQSFSAHPWTGFVIGALVTVVVQSSSVTTGITIALALSSAITFEQAVPLILGENIGTTITANIAALGGSHTAKQAARAHFIINAIGACLALLLLSPFMKFVLFFSPALDEARQIANAHTIFNILNTILFLPFINWVSKLTEFLVFGKKEKEELYYLEKTSLEEPGTALDQVRMALSEMHGFTMKFFKIVADCILRDDESEFFEIEKINQKISRYQSAVSEFLENITKRTLSNEQSKLITRFVRVIHEIERTGDYCNKLKEVALRLQGEGRKFHASEKDELKRLFKEVSEMLLKTLDILEMKKSTRKLATQIINSHAEIYEQKFQLLEKINKRVICRGGEIANSNYYHDAVSSLEEIAKKCRNIAQALIE